MKKLITIVLCALLLALAVPTNLTGQIPQSQQYVIYSAAPYDVRILKDGPSTNPTYVLVGYAALCDSILDVQACIIGNPSDSTGYQVDLYTKDYQSTDSCNIIEFFAFVLNGDQARAIIDRDGPCEVIIVGKINALRLKCTVEGEQTLRAFLTPETNSI